VKGGVVACYIGTGKVGIDMTVVVVVVVGIVVFVIVLVECDIVHGILGIQHGGS
jgi:hypothetical protein